MKIRHLENAHDYVQEVGICTLFSSKISEIPALWDVVDLPQEGGGKTKWGARVEAIWAWKNELPECYPDEVFYGKIPGGLAVLMSMKYLREIHYPKCHQTLSDCSELAQKVYEIIRLDPGTTAEVRAIAMDRHACSKGRFESALKQLQTTLNIMRHNEPGERNDRWLPFKELYSDFY
jgi:hypothetical protein